MSAFLIYRGFGVTVVGGQYSIDRGGVFMASVNSEDDAQAWIDEYKRNELRAARRKEAER